MGCNCKKSSSQQIRPSIRTFSAPKGRGINNGKTVSRVKHMMRRTIR